MIMTLGTLVTAVENDVRNLVLFVIQNDSYEITGNQRVPGAGKTDFAGFARAAGVPRAYTVDRASAYAEALPEILRGDGPVLVTLRVEPGREAPLGREGKETAAYLKLSAPDEVRRFRRVVSG
jgi:thiamine pyrophosphate-dependent acetolactate synthase large subunit-like protein